MYIAPMLLHHSVGVEVRVLIQRSSTVVLATDLYSAFIEERETVGCFQELHEIKFEPKNTQWTLVECRSLGQLAQSASEYACRLL